MEDFMILGTWDILNQPEAKRTSDHPPTYITHPVKNNITYIFHICPEIA